MPLASGGGLLAVGGPVHVTGTTIPELFREPSIISGVLDRFWMDFWMDC